MTAIDYGDRCVCCGRDTSFGSGRFVNRVPADIEIDGEERDGYLCEPCQDDHQDEHADAFGDEHCENCPLCGVNAQAQED